MKYLILLCLLSPWAWADPWEIRTESGKFLMLKGPLPAQGSEPKTWGTKFTVRDLSTRDLDYIHQLALDNEGPSQAELIQALREAVDTGDKSKLNAVKAKEANVEAKFPKPSASVLPVGP